MQPTVFVIDHDAAARESVVGLVGRKGLNAKGFASVEEFLAHHNTDQPEVVVAEVYAPGQSGLDVLQRLKSRRGSVAIIGMTAHADIPMAVRAMQAGAVAFLEKPPQEQELWQAITLALEIAKTAHAAGKQRAEIESRLATLTEEELSVLRRLLEGHPNKRIATDLDIGLRTVELRRANIMRKMQASSLPDLVRMTMLAEFPLGGPSS